MWEIYPLFIATQTAELILQESLNEVGISAFIFQGAFSHFYYCFFLPEAQWGDTLNAGDTLSIYKKPHCGSAMAQSPARMVMRILCLGEFLIGIKLYS